jgi:hypothetical protein
LLLRCRTCRSCVRISATGENIKGVAFRPQASRRLSRSGVYVPPVVWLNPSS